MRLKFKPGEIVYYTDYSDYDRSGIYEITKAYISIHEEKLYNIKDEDGNIAEDIFEEELSIID
jgi:hypothetical protein